MFPKDVSEVLCKSLDNGIAASSHMGNKRDLSRHNIADSGSGRITSSSKPSCVEFGLRCFDAISPAREEECANFPHKRAPNIRASIDNEPCYFQSVTSGSASSFALVYAKTILRDYRCELSVDGRPGFVVFA